MKPVGLDDPRTGRWPYAVVQLRQDNALGTLWNMVGFQTKLKHAEQVRIFRMIPGLENAEFARLGGFRRRHVPGLRRSCSTGNCGFRKQPRLRFAGRDHRCRRLCGERGHGTPGRTFCCRGAHGQTLDAPPLTTALGALIGHITGGHLDRGQKYGEQFRHIGRHAVFQVVFRLVDAPIEHDSAGWR